jgi:hypothetical protein
MQITKCKLQNANYKMQIAKRNKFLPFQILLLKDN